MESISVFSLRACYRKTPSVKVRPVPEMGICLVFTPAKPDLYTLNPAAWLVLELCDGRTGRELMVAYAAAMADASRASLNDIEDVRGIVRDMEGKGIIERQHGRSARTI